MLDHEGDRHIYVQVAEILRQRLTAGEIKPGEALPSEAELQREFGIARTTARRAVALLREDGVVHTVPNEGTFAGPAGEQARQRDRDLPMFRKIARDIADQIAGGAIQPRRPIPSETTLMQRYEVARETVRRAVSLLREQGWVYTQPQRGSYASPQERWPEPDRPSEM
ncbi:winged helix-turn-helix domain-containing protein [Sphaerisporangium sp. TRM90804]|uniref:GntR family transcriptional regulator n=1 Tax=Sphaerisporangium sp. TRM90804 TaxID=3031113 RepID=UPI0024486716|nr:winged helix-turn-helix domain-containing protein [Sphaerisporangium sp. TRM90804]MDH2424705.1 winged helix-turn-helix domain-containing protein [Sphaerisporangium sp. TRM90804]